MATSSQHVPDPFQLEDSDDSISSDEEEEHAPLGLLAASINKNGSAANSGLQSPSGLPHEVPLSSPLPSSYNSASRAGTSAAEVHNPLPRTPVDNEVPALFLPGLINPNLFLPIPNSDQISILLGKYIVPEARPVRDLTGTWENSDVHSLVMTNSWRALAKMARDRIVQSSPDDPVLIFELWYLRLSSLARLRLFNQAAAECTNFFNILSNVQPDLVRTYIFESLLPFELEMMFARTKYWAADPYGYLDELYSIITKCKRQSRAATSASDVEMWKERAVRVGLIIASQLLEMKDHTAAALILAPLCRPDPRTNPAPSPALLSSMARIYLDAGDIDSAAALFLQAEADPSCEEITKEINRALLASARLDWNTAVENLSSAIKREPDNALVANNLSVALLSLGRLKEGIQYMEAALAASPSIVGNVEPFLFNLATLYELRTSASFDKKCDLLLEISKWAGDGLRANCLKLPPV